MGDTYTHNLAGRQMVVDCCVDKAYLSTLHRVCADSKVHDVAQHLHTNDAASKYLLSY